jgi:hypothetical protein
MECTKRKRKTTIPAPISAATESNFTQPFVRYELREINYARNLRPAKMLRMITMNFSNHSWQIWITLKQICHESEPLWGTEPIFWPISTA